MKSRIPLDISPSSECRSSAGSGALVRAPGVLSSIRATIGVILISMSVFGPAEVAEGADEDLETFEAVWRAVDRKFYDRDHHGVDWDGVRDRYRPRIVQAKSRGEAREVMDSMLSELGASHTAILDGAVYKGMMAELMNRRARTFGLLLEESMPRRLFVRSLYEGGPAERAGLKVGDRIVGIDGFPVKESEALVSAGYDPGLPGAPLYFLRADEALSLVVQSSPDAETRRVTTMSPTLMNAVDAARNSVRVVQAGSTRIGVMHIWFCSRGVPEAVREALSGPLAKCDALVLDIRGRGGYSDVVTQLLDLFRGSASMMQRFRGKRSKPMWEKPLVVLIDDRSRSAKEMFSEQVRNLKLGTLVGQRTEGAVLGAMFHPLPDGSYLELAGVAVPVRGKSLEGVGVEPDVDVDYVIPYCEGVDPILEKGLQVALKKVRSAVRARARGPF